MRDDYIFGLLADIRQQIINGAVNVPESKRSIVPEGFNNHLHWQIGHILTVTDALIFQFALRESRIPESYTAFFASGSRPSDWSRHPPDWDGIVSQLQDQMEQIREAFAGKLSERVSVSDNFLQAKVAGDLFQVFVSHESMHAGMITAMIKTLKNK